jgi:hypothetical protein
MQAFFSYIFTSRKTRSSKCQSWDGDVKKNHLCPGYVATVFFLFFELEKKAYYHRKNRTQNSWIPCEFPPSLSPTPKRGGGELNVGLTRLPPYPPAFLNSPLPGGVCVFFTPLTMGVTPAWHPIKKNGLKPVQKMALGPPLRSQDKI